MTKVDEWRERTIGPRSIFQTSEVATIHSDLLLSPAPSRVIVSSDNWTLTPGERKAKRRKILDSAEDVSAGRALPLVSVPRGGGSLFNTVSRVLKERGQDWPKRDRGRRSTKVWMDVDDHMTILRRGRSPRRVAESPMVVDETVLQAQSSQDAVQPASHLALSNAKSSPERRLLHDDHASIKHLSSDHRTAVSPVSRTKKKGKVISTIRQRVLTKSFKGSKPCIVSNSTTDAAKSSHTGNKDGIPIDDTVGIRVQPTESPFMYHKKRSLPIQDATTGQSLVSKHLNTLLPVSPETGKTSSSLRNSLLKEMRSNGAEIITTNEKTPSSHRPNAEAQPVATQALLGRAQSALISTPSRNALHAVQPSAADVDGEQSMNEQRRAIRLPAETQALLGGWTPWSEKDQTELRFTDRNTPPAKTEASDPPQPKRASRLSRMNSRTSLEQLLDLEWSHNSPLDQSMDMTEVAGPDIVKSSFQAAQDMSLNALETQSQLGRDIAEVAQGVLA